MTFLTRPASPALLATACLITLPACSDDGEADTSAVDESGSTTGESGPDTEESGETGETEPEPAVEWPTLGCDPLVPDHCAYPYPNNVYTVADEGTETGRRLAFSDTFMPVGADHQPTPETWHQSDGFSPASTMLAYLPGATTTGLPTPLTIEDSLADGSPTVLIEAETGARVPHWAELDMSHDNDARRTFMIRPAVRLEPDTRYIVAIRGVVDAGGAALEPSPAFAALRDISPSDALDPAAAESVEARRPLYADIFARLGDAGVAREDLQLAWDFTTASDANITGPLVHMRDVGLDMLGAEPLWSIVELEIDPEPGLAARVTGSLTVPLFLDDPGPGGRMTFDAEGLPEALTTAEYEFMVLVPSSAYVEPAGLVQFGHGLFGSYADIDNNMLHAFAADRNLVIFASSWIGMAGEDVGHIGVLLQQGRLDDWPTVVDRLGQGVFNALALMRLMKTSFADAPELLGPNMEPLLIDSDQAYYFGASQGGILGSPYMALTTDVERGALAVPGQPYSLLLNRSEAWQDFSLLSKAAYDDTLDLRFAIELMQQLWDRTEPSGYSRHVIDNPLPGTPNHDVIVFDALGDHLVTTLGAHIMVRELGIPQLAPTNREIFAIDAVEQPFEGSALIEYDFGLPPEPLTNVPMTEGSDPHGALADVPIAVDTIEQFLRTGVAESFCDGVCDPQ
jgi:hypothetical protein